MGRTSEDRREKRTRLRRSSEASSEDALSPPSYSVEENSQGEWVNTRLNVKWPQQASIRQINKHRYIGFDTSGDPQDAGNSQRTSRRESTKRSRSEKGRKEKSRDMGPVQSSQKSAQYITLSSSARDQYRSARTPSIRSPAPSAQAPCNWSEDGSQRVIDSFVFDTRSAMDRHQKRGSTTAASVPMQTTDREEYGRYFAGVQSRQSVIKQIRGPGEFIIYYERPSEGEMPLEVELRLAYLSSESQAHFFPIKSLMGDDKMKHYFVMQNKNDGKIFPSILSLVRYYSLYASVDLKTGRMETFAIPV